MLRLPCIERKLTHPTLGIGQFGHFRERYTDGILGGT